MQFLLSQALHEVVHLLDQSGAQILRQERDVSFRRFYVLSAISTYGPLSQHALAQRLGYSDAAVSKMVPLLAKDGYLTVAIDPQHGRRRIVQVTTRGQALAQECLQLLEVRLGELMRARGIDGAAYSHATKQLRTALLLSER